MRTKIELTLRPFGITPKYRGYRLLVTAIEEAMLQIEQNSALHGGLYYTVGERCGCNAHTAERNIRTLVRRAWQVNRQLVIDTAGYPLDTAPTVTEFVEMIANKLLRKQDEINTSMYVRR